MLQHPYITGFSGIPVTKPSTDVSFIAHPNHNAFFMYIVGSNPHSMYAHF